MQNFKMNSFNPLLLITLLLSIVTVGCGGGHWDPASENPDNDPVITTPTVTSTLPGDNDVGVAVTVTPIVTFSQAMNPATINETNFVLTDPDNAPVAGGVTYVGNTATFTPDAELLPDTTYSARVTTGAENSGGEPLADEVQWSFETAAASIIPTVESTIPTNDAEDVARDSAVTIVFSQAMDAATLNSANFTLVGPDLIPVEGDFEFNDIDNTLVFTPLLPLAPITIYTAKLTTGVTDNLGEALAADTTWTFETAALVIPTVTSTIPADDAENVAINTAVTVVFNQAMNTTTLNALNFMLVGPDTLEVQGTFEYSATGKTLVFTPLLPLAPNALYTATLSTDVTDALGEPLATEVEWEFETAIAADVIAPQVSDRFPTPLATGICSNKDIQAIFTEPMNPISLESPATTFTVMTTLDEVAVAGQVTLDATHTIATFTPTLPLATGTEYTATVSASAKDLAGNGLIMDDVWTFTTRQIVCQEPIVLDHTATYGVLSNTGVTLGGGPNSVTGFRVVGNVGIFPTGMCVGCDTTTVDGLIAIGNVPAQDAMTELTAIYNEAIGRTTGVCTLIGSGSLVTNPSAACGGGADGIFTPGLYWSASSIAIPAGGTITLDAQNDADAVFIFQSESTIDTIGGDTHIILANQAQAKNVFWVAKSSATIGGTTSDFAGTVIALVAITVNEGTEMEGRAFARSAAVTVQDNAVITVPAP